jgi:hypothetical protein
VVTLPSQLATSASRSPSLFAYQAALIKLDANELYSPLKIAAMVDPAVKGIKAVLEQHHLFPRANLEEIGIDDFKQINQIANFAAVEWPANIKIGKKPPAEYVPPLDHSMSGEDRDQMYGWHALPPLWWELPYQEFLVHRRVRIEVVCRRIDLVDKNVDAGGRRESGCGERVNRNKSRDPSAVKERPRSSLAPATAQRNSRRWEAG